MSASQSPSAIIGLIQRDAGLLERALRRGDPSVCARIRSFSPQFSDASDAEILAARGINAHDMASRERGFADWDAAREANLGHKLLPGDANLEHLRKQAKKLLRAFQAGEASAVQRASAQGKEGDFTLNEAQFVLAREYGSDSWPKLVARITAQEGEVSLTKPQLRAIESIHDRCWPQLDSTFSRHLGQSATSDTAFLDQTTYAAFSASLARPGCLCSFSVDALRARAVIDLAMPLASAILGKAEEEDPWLTEDEKARMMPVFQEILAALQEAWEPILHSPFRDMQVASDPQLVRPVEPHATVVFPCFEISTVERVDLVPVAYPVSGGLYELRHQLEGLS